MSIQSNQLKYREEFSIKSNILDNLNDNLSTSFCPSISFSFDNSHELKTELYTRDNAQSRKFNYLNIPEYIKYYL